MQPTGPDASRKTCSGHGAGVAGACSCDAEPKPRSSFGRFHARRIAAGYSPRPLLEGGRPQLRERRDERRCLVVGIEPARVGQHPDPGPADPRLLAPTTAFGASNPMRYAVRPSTASHAGRNSSTRAEQLGAGPDLGVAQFGRGGRGPGNDVRDADPARQQRVALGRQQDPVGEAGTVQRPPEPVARPREVKARRASSRGPG